MGNRAVHKLLSEENQKWFGVLQSSDWQEVVVPHIQKELAALDRQLRTPMALRKPAVPSDYLRGMMDFAEALIVDREKAVSAEVAMVVEEIIAQRFDVMDTTTEQ